METFNQYVEFRDFWTFELSEWKFNLKPISWEPNKENSLFNFYVDVNPFDTQPGIEASFNHERPIAMKEKSFTR